MFFDQALSGPPLGTDRPHFGKRQVRTLRGIKVGNKYRKMYEKHGPGKFWVVKEEPFQDSDGDWWVKCYIYYSPRGEKTVQKHSLADAGVVAYTSGFPWNQFNWPKRV